MSAVQTILVFVVIPLIITGLMAVLIWGPGAARAPRYRPGRDWPYEPVWYAPHPLAVLDPADEAHPPARVPQLSPGASVPPPPPPGTAPTAAGGARGTW
ncbi:MAG: hypothetical protein M3400_13130 [Actinomycetota bacterium]|nr:hypothetical protein [Actinomycetota bacterium]